MRDYIILKWQNTYENWVIARKRTSPKKWGKTLLSVSNRVWKSERPLKIEKVAGVALGWPQLAITSKWLLDGRENLNELVWAWVPTKQWGIHTNKKIFTRRDCKKLRECRNMRKWQKEGIEISVQGRGKAISKDSLKWGRWEWLIENFSNFTQSIIQWNNIYKFINYPTEFQVYIYI